MQRGSASTSTTGAISTTCRRTSAGSSASTQSNRSTTGSRRPSSRRSRDWRRRDALLARRERSARRRQAPSHRQTERKEPGGAGRLGIRRVHWRDGPMKPHRGAWQRGAACIQRRRCVRDDPRSIAVLRSTAPALNTSAGGPALTVPLGKRRFQASRRLPRPDPGHDGHRQRDDHGAVLGGDEPPRQTPRPVEILQVERDIRW